MSHMDEKDALKVRQVADLVADESLTLDAARRLAALDPDIRIAMSGLWWSALRIGLGLDRDLPLCLPRDPFGASEMEAAGYLPRDF